MRYFPKDQDTLKGLNQFGVNMEFVDDAGRQYESICRRIGLRVPMNDHKEFAENFLADCESGWDFTPRCFMQQKNSAYVEGCIREKTPTDEFLLLEW